MNDYLNAILDTITGMSPTTVIGGLILALLLALPMALAYAACRRKAVGNDAEGKGDAHAMPLVMLAMVANLIGMAVASGYGAYSLGMARAATNPSPPPPWVLPGDGRPPGPPDGLARGLTRDVFETSDANHDGLLSVDEATTAAAALIRTAAGEGKDTVDAEVLSAALRERLRPPGPRPGAAEEAIKKGQTGPR
jgi:hypothetical protein